MSNAFQFTQSTKLYASQRPLTSSLFCVRYWPITLEGQAKSSALVMQVGQEEEARMSQHMHMVILILCIRKAHPRPLDWRMQYLEGLHQCVIYSSMILNTVDWTDCFIQSQELPEQHAAVSCFHGLVKIGSHWNDWNKDTFSIVSILQTFCNLWTNKMERIGALCQGLSMI